jgi:cellulose synthase/poly-beta-1,6-N-acetylglucosamine synthase-like glycosyltransferase
MWASYVFIGMAMLFLASSAAALWHLRWVHRLPALESFPTSAPAPRPVRCSVVMAARDEESRIEASIHHLLAQRGVECELIIVDDRSRDRTPQILKHLAAQHPNVHVKRVDVLPSDWLGKCHACHIGANAATGEWILFTDADCWLQPDVIARAVQVAEHDHADHVTLTPGIAVRSLRMRAWHLLFLTSLANWFSGVNRDRPGSYIGIGAFNLVRAGAYRECGGYEALRMTVVDDVKLGLLLRRAGKRSRAFLGAGEVECHWGKTLGAMIKVLEKNYFAMLEYRLWLALLGATAFLLVAGIVLAGLMSRTLAGLSAGLAPLAFVAPGLVLARRLGWSKWSALGTPFMLPVFFVALLNSTWVTLRQGGVRWRDTLYPIDVLRAKTVR